MRIDIYANGFELTDHLRSHIERRLQFALGRVNDNLDKVHVRLSDVNGPRRGQDKCCQIQIPLCGKQDIVVEDTETDIHAAIDRAADRAGRTLLRRLARLREHRYSRNFDSQIEE